MIPVKRDVPFLTPMMPHITCRALTEAEARLLHQELKNTPYILGYTVRELQSLQEVWVAEDAGELAGVCVSVDLAGNWTEISFLLVLPAFRGQGYGRDLFREAWQQARYRQRHVYVLSRNPTVLKWMSELGITVTRRLWAAPWSVHWHMQKHMASWYRCREQWRKRQAIQQCPPLQQGIQKASS